MNAFRLDNTSGYSQHDLDQINCEWQGIVDRERLANYQEALKKAKSVASEYGYDEDKLDTRRQVKKFHKGYGIVRKLAGLPHGKANSK